MKGRFGLVLAVLFLFSSVGLRGASAQFIVRTSLGEQAVRNACLLAGCSVVGGLDDSLGKLFLIKTSPLLNPAFVLLRLLGLNGIVAIEPDLLTRIQSDSVSTLSNSTLVNYYGVQVRQGYVDQPASLIVRLSEARTAFNVGGAGIVAVIDTGVDPEHPALKGVLVAGYDFIRNREGMGSEMSDVNQSTAALVDGDRPPAWVNQSTAALVDQSTAALVDNPEYAAFGHGTMVAGIVHLVAPRAMIMPMKAFSADGSGRLSNIIRAIYRSVHHNAKIINMSFSLSTPSPELRNAMNYADNNNVICVASAGNNGKQVLMYPAAFDNVIGVASTTNDDARSAFSNYGANLVWVAAPGEGIVTTYPFKTYAAAWGTSFSTPFVSGAAALLLDVKADANLVDAAEGVAFAKWISGEMGRGRLDIYQALRHWLQE